MGLAQAWTATDGSGISAPSAYHRVVRVTQDLERERVDIEVAIYITRAIRDDPIGVPVHRLPFAVINGEMKDQEGNIVPDPARQDYNDHFGGTKLNGAGKNPVKAAYEWLGTSGHPSAAVYDGNTTEV